MFIELLGWFHLVHCPLLILYPIVYSSWLTDVLYIKYFFIIMFSYTFIEGECPISYAAKVKLDPDYVAGTKIEYYPEMKFILQDDVYINYYFTINTILYFGSLFYVSHRAKISFLFVSVPYAMLLVYFLHIRNIYFKKTTDSFSMLQNLTRFVLYCYIIIPFTPLEKV